MDENTNDFPQFPPPDLCIGINCALDGEINFHSLRVEGKFQGVLSCTKGFIYVTSSGTIIGDITECKLVIIEGTVIGNISAEYIIIRGNASIQGDVSGHSVEVGPQAQINGKMQVTSSNKRSNYSNDISNNGYSNKKVILLIIDPQMDYTPPNGSMAIKTAIEDSERCSNFIKTHGHLLDEIFVSLNSHHRMHITHSIFWTDSNGNSPEAYTSISAEDVANGIWKPRDNSQHILEYVSYYTSELESRGKRKLTIWPDNCLIGSPGHAIIPCINDALQEWASDKLNTITYIMKGTNCLTEMYSALSAEIEIASDPSTQVDMNMVQRLITADRLLICGQALSHCVNYTVRDLMSHISPDYVSRINLVKDGCSPLPNYEDMAREFVGEVQFKGVTVLNWNEVARQINIR